MSAEDTRRRRLPWPVPEGVIVAFVYLCAQGLMFLNKGIYWDDWVWYRQPPTLLADVSRQLGSLWPAWAFWAPYQSDFAIWLTRIAVAGCYLAAALWFLGILRDMGVDRRTRLLMALAFAVFPVNGARVPIATAAYGVSLALFTGGFRLVVASMRRTGAATVWLRVAAAACLFFSLRTASFGVLLPLPLAYVIWREGAAREPRRWVGIALRHGELIVIPVAYVLLHTFALVPSGLYGDYNVVGSSSMGASLKGLLAGVWHSTADPTLLGVRALFGVGGLVAAILVLAALYSVRQSKDPTPMSRRVGAWWAAAGFVLVVVAVVPYVLVGKVPALDDFSSRFQLLVPFGAALLFGGALRLVFGARPRGELVMFVVAALLLGGFVAADVSNNMSYLSERYKHIAMMQDMQAAPEFRTATTFTFLDTTTELNANGRSSTRDYEYAGMMAAVFGNQTRFGADTAEFAASGGISAYRAQFTSVYKMSAYVERPPQYRAEILPGPLALDRTSTVLRLLATDLFAPSALPSATVGAVEFRLVPAATSG